MHVGYCWISLVYARVRDWRHVFLHTISTKKAFPLRPFCLLPCPLAMPACRACSALQLFGSKMDTVNLAADKFTEGMGSRMTEFTIDPAKGTATMRKVW